jgi:hypothetical protein
MTFSDWLDTQISDATHILKLIVVFGLTAFVFWRSLKSGMGLGAIVVGLLTGGLLYYGVIGGGIEDIGKMLDKQSQTQ